MFYWQIIHDIENNIGIRQKQTILLLMLLL
jgi:hypothetical protein